MVSRERWRDEKINELGDGPSGDAEQLRLTAATGGGETRRQWAVVVRPIHHMKHLLELPRPAGYCHGMSRITRNLIDVALNAGRNKKSLEPTRLAAAYGWFHGENLVSPPAIAKQRHLLNTFKSRGHRIFVEAGTYKGETTAFLVPYADQVISVELHDGLFAAAKQRFAKYPNVSLIHGDSLVEIPKVVANCSSPPLVFLDGHFSGEGTATGEEMEPAESTLRRLADVAPAGTTIVIDDLRLFGSGLAGFPQLDAITTAARAAFPTAIIRAGLDSIVIEVLGKDGK